MNRWRQRALVLICGGVVVLLMGGCQARSSAEAAQTAIAVAQTAIPALPTGLPSAVDQIRPLLAGASLDVHTTPPDAANDGLTLP